MINPELTQTVINKLVNSSECMDSIRNIKCYDYEARFEAFIRVKHSIILTTYIDWSKVATTINTSL